PVALLRLTADGDLERAVACELELIPVELAGRPHRAVALVAAALRAERDVGRIAARARDTVAVLPGDVRVAGHVVRVVVADLDRLVRELEETRKARVGELELALEARAQQARQVAVALRAVERVRGHLLAQHHLAGALERAAELAPGRAVADPALRVARHR